MEQLSRLTHLLETGPNLAKLIYFLFNPFFAFATIGKVPRSVLYSELYIVLFCVMVVSLGVVLGVVLVLSWGQKQRMLQCMTVMTVAFSNVGSLPLYMAGALPMLDRDEVYSYLVVYISTQSFLMWGCFYPLCMVYIRSEETPLPPVEMERISVSSGEEEELSLDSISGPKVPVKEVLKHVFNPITISVIVGVIVALIPPLQHFLFVTFPLLAKVASTLGDANVGAHLLILGLGMYPLKLESEWLLVIVSTLVRLLIVPAVFFTFMLVFFRSFILSLPPALSWVPLTLSGTPTNLGMLVMADRFGSKGAPQILLCCYLVGLATVPFFNVMIFSVIG
jgi:hypothetical protein